MASRFISSGSYFDDEHALDTFERQAGESLKIAMERLRIILDRALITETPEDLITMRNERILRILPSLVSSHTAGKLRLFKSKEVSTKGRHAPLKQLIDR